MYKKYYNGYINGQSYHISKGLAQPKQKLRYGNIIWCYTFQFCWLNITRTYNIEINILLYVIDSIQFGFAMHPSHISFYNGLYWKVKRRLVYKIFIRNFKFRYDIDYPSMISDVLWKFFGIQVLVHVLLELLREVEHAQMT